jgi:DNA repair protein RadD
MILDHAGTHLRLGLVTNINHECLDAGKRRKGADKKTARVEPLVILCTESKAVLSPRLKTCTECRTAREAKTDIEHRDGVLVELGSGHAPRYVPTISDMAAFLGELKWVAREQGYAPGWAAHKFKERFGAWPNDPRIAFASASPPSLKTRGWIKSRQIAFAKGLSAYG